MTGTGPAGRRNAAAPPTAAPAATGTRQPGHRNAAPWQAPGWRRGLQLALAALWLLDAVLQFQTFMFSQGFPRMLAATSAGNPAGVAGPRPVLCPRLAACCQIMMGVAMAYMLILML